jgi:hypothetical protein
MMHVAAVDAGATVPAWVAVAIGVLTAGGAVAAAMITAWSARKRLAEQLAYEREARIRDERRQVLDEAVAIAVRFREELAIRLRKLVGSAKVPTGEREPLALDRDDLIELRGVAARLRIRFGANSDVTNAFYAFYDAVKAGVVFARENKLPEPVPSLENPARDRRHGATDALDALLDAARRELDRDPRSTTSRARHRGSGRSPSTLRARVGSEHSPPPSG